MTDTDFPAEGRGVDELLDEMRVERQGDLDWRGGKAFSLVYNTDDPELEKLQHEVAGPEKQKEPLQKVLQQCC